MLLQSLMNSLQDKLVVVIWGRLEMPSGVVKFKFGVVIE